MRKAFLFFFLIFIPFFFPVPVSARLGVGVGTGKIVVSDILKPGIIYNLPEVAVLNTGDQPSEYGITVAYHQDQPELQPPKEWFTFTPSQFHLEPGKVQLVKIKLNLPIRTVPGEYFAYLEGFPVQPSDNGATIVGIAAASKLYFTVAPANLITGIYYRVLSFWKEYQPWTDRISRFVIIVLVVIVFSRFFKIEIKGFSKGKKENGELR